MASAPGSNERTALIVGAGIGGLAAGVALRHVAWNVRIFERAASPRELGFALLLAPNALSALRRLGLADRVIAGGIRATGGQIRRADGRLLRRFDANRLLQILPEPPVVVLRPVLHEALLDAVGPEAVALGNAALGFERRERQVALKLANGSVVTGDVLIGADGVGSVIRRALHPSEPPPRQSRLFALRGVAYRVQRPGELSGVQYFGRGTEAGVAQASQDSVYWYLSLPAEYLAYGTRDPVEVARRATTGFDEKFLEIVNATRAEDIRLDELFDRDPIRNWGTGCVTLLGDAAHPMLPHAGQGAAQALEDAVTLGHVLGLEQNLEAALRRYEQLRFERMRKVLFTARRNARLASVRSPAACWVRDTVLRLIPASFIAKSYLAFGTPPELAQTTSPSD